MEVSPEGPLPQLVVGPNLVEIRVPSKSQSIPVPIQPLKNFNPVPRVARVEGLLGDSPFLKEMPINGVDPPALDFSADGKNFSDPQHARNILPQLDIWSQQSAAFQPSLSIGRNAKKWVIVKNQEAANRLIQNALELARALRISRFKFNGILATDQQRNPALIADVDYYKQFFASLRRNSSNSENVIIEITIPAPTSVSIEYPGLCELAQEVDYISVEPTRAAESISCVSPQHIAENAKKILNKCKLEDDQIIIEFSTDCWATKVKNMEERCNGQSVLRWRRYAQRCLQTDVCNYRHERLADCIPTEETTIGLDIRQPTCRSNDTDVFCEDDTSVRDRIQLGVGFRILNPAGGIPYGKKGSLLSAAEDAMKNNPRQKNASATDEAANRAQQQEVSNFSSEENQLPMSLMAKIPLFVFFIILLIT